MRTKMLWLVNGFVVFGTALFLWFTLVDRPGLLAAPPHLPGPVSEAVTITGLAFVTYADGRAGEGSSGTVTTQIYPVSESGNLMENAPPDTLYNRPDPASCETDALQASPNGLYVTLTYNCEANYFAQILRTSGSDNEPTFLPRGVFLDWSPDGNWFLFRETDEDVVWLVDIVGNERFPLNLPAGTYRATFTPDGQRILYAASVGLGYGSEAGILDIKRAVRTVWQRQPHHIIGTPQWSPDGRQIAYILLPDNNVPYTVGELWLADDTG